MPLARDDQGNPVQLLMPTGVSHKVTFAVASAVSAADFSDETIAVELIADQDCFVKFGDSAVVADANSIFVKGGSPIVYPVGDHKRFAAIQRTAGGDIFANEIRG